VLKGAGHWLLEEQPDATTSALTQFLGDKTASR
jgi:hypothetical protein